MILELYYFFSIIAYIHLQYNALKEKDLRVSLDDDGKLRHIFYYIPYIGIAIYFIEKNVKNSVGNTFKQFLSLRKTLNKKSERYKKYYSKSDLIVFIIALFLASIFFLLFSFVVTHIAILLYIYGKTHNDDTKQILDKLKDME